MQERTLKKKDLDCKNFERNFFFARKIFKNFKKNLDWKIFERNFFLQKEL